MSETFCEFECRRNVLFTSKNHFLKVRSALKSGRIAVHENLDVIKRQFDEQTALASYRKVQKK